MKTFASALIALSVLAGVSAPASALDAKMSWEQKDRVSQAPVAGPPTGGAIVW